MTTFATDTPADEAPQDAGEEIPVDAAPAAGVLPDGIAPLGAKQRAVLQALTGGPARARDLATHLKEERTATVTNLLRRLADRDLVTHLDDGRWDLVAGADDTLAALFRPSLLGLTGYQRDILEILAANGEPIRTGQLVASLGRPQNAVAATLLTLRRRGLATSPSHGFWTLPGRHIALALQASAPSGHSGPGPTPATAVTQTGVALEGDETRFPAPAPSPAAEAASNLAVSPRRPWETERDRPLAGPDRIKPKQTNTKLAGSVRQRLDATMRWLEVQDDDSFEATEDIRDVYNLSDAMNMAVHSWLSRVERDYNSGKPFKQGRRTRKT